MVSPVVGNRLPGQTPPPAQNTSISYSSFIKNCQNIFARGLRTIRRDGFCFDGTRRNRFSGAGVPPEFVAFVSRAKLPPGRRRYLTALYLDACGHNSDHSNRGDLSGACIFEPLQRGKPGQGNSCSHREDPHSTPQELHPDCRLALHLAQPEAGASPHLYS
jgi:hypothetical protein